MIVRDLPPAYLGYRERLLKLAYNFAKLDENIREKYADPASRYRCVFEDLSSSITLDLVILCAVLGGRTARYVKFSLRARMFSCLVLGNNEWETRLVLSNYIHGVWLNSNRYAQGIILC